MPFIKSFLKRGNDLISPWTGTLESTGDGFLKAPKERDLFPAVDPAIDGEDCLHDCESCTIKYPSKFKIEEDLPLYGWVKGWSTHLLVATGKTDWVRNCEEEKGSLMEAVDKSKKPSNGRMMLSATNIPVPDEDREPYDQPTRVMLLPAFIWVENVSYENVSELITHVVDSAPTTTTPMGPSEEQSLSNGLRKTLVTDKLSKAASNGHADPCNLTIPPELPFTTRPVGHSAIILLCSQATRDARCGQSAPLLRREFERHLRPLGLYRDLHDERPGGVGIYFISHTGGHKFSANVIVYRRKSMDRWIRPEPGVVSKQEPESEEELSWGAAQGIWLARVKPNECEGIVKYTVLQGKVVKPEWQLRGGFDRCKKLVSW